VINDQKIEIWGDGEVVRDYIYIKDAVEVLAGSLKIEADEKVFNLSYGQGYSLNQIIETIKNITDKKINLEYQKSRKLDVPVNILNNEKVKKTFNWSPRTNLEDGIKKTFEHFSEEKNL